MKNIKLISITILSFLLSAAGIDAQIQSDIDKANLAGKVVFLVVTDGDDGLDSARALADEAHKQFPKSKVITFDRKDKSNSDLMDKYRLKPAKVPLVVVIATNGYPAAGARTKYLTVESILQMIPTHKEEGVIKAMNTGISAFVVFTKSTDTNNIKQMDACQSACKLIEDQAVTINVDIDDQSEQSFINKFNIDRNAVFPVTMFINGTGKVVNKFNGVNDVKDLVAAASKKK